MTAIHGREAVAHCGPWHARVGRVSPRCYPRPKGRRSVAATRWRAWWGPPLPLYPRPKGRGSLRQGAVLTTSGGRTPAIHGRKAVAHCGPGSGSSWGVPGPAGRRSIHGRKAVAPLRPSRLTGVPQFSIALCGMPYPRPKGRGSIAAPTGRVRPGAGGRRRRSGLSNRGSVVVEGARRRHCPPAEDLDGGADDWPIPRCPCSTSA